MLDVAVYVGIRPMEFWDLTPLEISSVIHAFNKKTKQDHEDRLVMTYLGAYWQRVKKMPSLKEVLNDTPRESKKQSAENMLEVVKRLNLAMGGTVY